MSAEANDVVSDIPSELAIAHARAGRCCQLCGVKNFAIGGRTPEGRFIRLYQAQENAAEARQRIGQLSWCGLLERERMLRVFRIVCEVVSIDSGAAVLVCGHCVRAVRDRAHVEIVR